MNSRRSTCVPRSALQYRVNDALGAARIAREQLARARACSSAFPWPPNRPWRGRGRRQVRTASPHRCVTASAARTHAVSLAALGEPRTTARSTRTSRSCARTHRLRAARTHSQRVGATPLDSLRPCARSPSRPRRTRSPRRPTRSPAARSLECASSRGSRAIAPRLPAHHAGGEQFLFKVHRAHTPAGCAGSSTSRSSSVRSASRIRRSAVDVEKRTLEVPY